MIEITNASKKMTAKVISWDNYEMPYDLSYYYKLEFDNEYTPQIGDIISFSSEEEAKETIVYKIIIDGAFYNPFNYYPEHNAPKDGYLPVGSKVRKLIRSIASGNAAHAEGAGT